MASQASPEAAAATSGAAAPAQEVSATPDYDASLAFLRRWKPEGPWVLTAIGPDRTGIETRTFGTAEEDELRRWLQAQGAGRNVYFSVNPATRSLSKKAERTDIAALAWLHVDLDPRVGEDLAAERARILSLLRNPPGDIPPPTVIVYSGGGYQGFWKLDAPVPIGGDLDKAEDAKRWNLSLELDFGGDNCHNVDRIMRLPGTVNRPDARKRRKGRSEALAAVVEWHDDRVYPLRRFAAAPAERSPVEAGPPVVRISDPASVRRLASVDDLPKSVSDKAKIVIVQGVDPDEPNKHPSRSEWVFFVANDMVRGGCDDDTIYSVLTDPQFGISASVLEQGSGAHDYAIRQIERAREGLGGKQPVQLPGGLRQHTHTAADLAPLVARRGWCRRGRAIFSLGPNGYLEPVKPHRAVTEFESVATFFRMSTDRSGATTQVPAVMSAEIARVLLESSEILDPLPEVQVISDCPVLVERAGGLAPVVGLDAESGILARGPEPEAVPFADAKALLVGLLRDWAFKEESDRARAVAAMLKPALAASGMLGEGRVPIDVIEADDSQAGKGFLCKMIAGIYRATAATVTQSSGGVGSVRESIATKLLEGRPFIQLDNWRGKLDEPFLEAALTENLIECRAPRSPGALVDPRRTSFMLTSNQAELTRDLANRACIVRIQKRPDSHRFHQWPEGGLHEHVKANQGRYLGAVWAVLREWHAQGKPLAEDSGEHDFRQWARAIRYIVRDLLGLADPLAATRQIQQEKSQPHLAWLRQVGIAIERAGRLGVELRANDLIEPCLDANVELPGAERGDVDGDETHVKICQAIGRRLRPLFQRGEVVDDGRAWQGVEVRKLLVDGMPVLRIEAPRQDDASKREKTYIFGEPKEGVGRAPALTGEQLDVPF